MVEREVIIRNRTGLHARPAAMIVQKANEFRSDIFLQRDEDRVNAKSIMGVMMLAAGEGTRIKVIAMGEDENEAVAEISRLLQSNLDGDEVK
jgi:phosphotransferase system HPr (HPr) family protein